MAVVNRFDVYLINLDPSPSDDPKNTRPAVIISPDEINRNIANVIVAPLSSTKNPYPTRVEVEFLNAPRSIILDQIRTVDKSRLVKKIGEISGEARLAALARLAEMFAE